MRKMLFTVAALLIAAGVYLAYLGWAAGEFRSVRNLYPGACRMVPGVAGPEDITIHPSGRFAYISSQDRRAGMAGAESVGAIYRYRLDPGGNGSGPTRADLAFDGGPDFRPHGISLFVDADGGESLFVVNHPGQSLFGPGPGADGPAHTIEIFERVGESLVQRKTLADDSMVSPNDIVAIDHQRFYFTNDHGSAPGLMRQLEDYLRLPWASVVYFDGREFHEVAGGLSYANGINVSPDGSSLYVAEVTRSRIAEYARDADTGTLEALRRFDVGFGVDNIEIDPASGDLWLGGHVKLLTFTQHAKNADVPAPSQVARVALAHEPVVETVFVDDGHLISGASVATQRNGRLLVGSVFEPHFVICEPLSGLH
ncbi:MAG: SMP-30/gluconolactonase/LRE family protein [Wenzhouxiangellaceae bacterium]|nr:SMP-30/gluconolactonase/LRE family protein [Wenzhouxiangellaceae bacterium]